MTGKIVYLGGGAPVAPAPPTDAPPTDPPTQPLPTPPPPPSSITYDVTCGGGIPCGDPGHYTLTMTAPSRTTPAGDPTVTCGDGDTIIFNFPVALGRTHPFQIIDQNGNDYPGLSAGYPFTGQGQVSFTYVILVLLLFCIFFSFLVFCIYLATHIQLLCERSGRRPSLLHVQSAWRHAWALHDRPDRHWLSSPTSPYHANRAFDVRASGQRPDRADRRHQFLRQVL
jgi:hypothetical protein